MIPLFRYKPRVTVLIPPPPLCRQVYRGWTTDTSAIVIPTDELHDRPRSAGDDSGQRQQQEQQLPTLAAPGLKPCPELAELFAFVMLRQQQPDASDERKQLS